MSKAFVVGTNLYAAQGGSLERMRTALDSWKSLDVPLADLAFVGGESVDEPGFERIECLRTDSTQLADPKGKAKPVITELLDGLAGFASRLGCEYFVFSNADIILTDKFAEIIRSTDLDSIAFTRFDFQDPSQIESGELFYKGLDTFSIRTKWWLEHRQLFRPYILGEWRWDEVYAVKLGRNGRSAISYRPDVCLHRKHDQNWNPNSKSGRYNDRLRLRFDYLEHSLWVNYSDALAQVDKSSSEFESIQAGLYQEMCKGFPRLWSRLKHPGAVVLSALK